jgi:hypothetical protein
MRKLVPFLAVAIAAAALIALARSRRIISARADLARMEARTAGQRARAFRPPALSAQTEAEIVRLRADNRDIYKLRGQITQAREKRNELERMQAENVRLREQIKRIKANPGTSAHPFSLANKGQATPDAALETAFWTMYQGDLESLSRLMPMATTEYERMPPAEKTNSIAMLRAMASTIEKLEILDRKSDSPDEAYLTVQIIPREGMNLAFPSRQSTFVLRRTNSIWQIVAERQVR